MSEVLSRLLAGISLSEDEAGGLLERLAGGTVEPALAGALLVALNRKGETVEEIRGFAGGMRALAVTPLFPEAAVEDAVDIVGTGGDGSGSLNLSTGSALLAAACGLPVIKHGNRSVTSRCGSADVLAELGLPMPLDPAAARRCLEQTGFTFLFAPHYHPAMKSLGRVRRALGVRTVFNMLGPLTNPARPPHHVIGAWSEPVAERLARCLSGMRIRRGFVVHGEPGWDEATPCGPFTLFDVRPGIVERRRRDPESVGIRRCRPEDLAGDTPAYNAASLRDALSGTPGAHQDAL
ncbi:MAG: anthranilate phosphoribosyltransferase, partial [Gemmatimonadota bacterium]